MLKVKKGHYRDTFMQIVFDIRFVKYPLGPTTVRGWDYVVRFNPADAEISPKVFGTKQAARSAALSRIAESL